jgi:hypothetical protein
VRCPFFLFLCGVVKLPDPDARLLLDCARRPRGKGRIATVKLPDLDARLLLDCARRPRGKGRIATVKLPDLDARLLSLGSARDGARSSLEDLAGRSAHFCRSSKRPTPLLLFVVGLFFSLQQMLIDHRGEQQKRHAVEGVFHGYSEHARS